MGVLAALREYVPESPQTERSKGEPSALRLISGSPPEERVWASPEKGIEGTMVEEVKLWRPGPVEENLPMD